MVGEPWTPLGVVQAARAIPRRRPEVRKGMKRMQADVRVAADRGVPVARIAGELDLANVEDVLGELLHAVPNSALGLVIDLSALEYLDSKGVHMLLQLEARLSRHGQQLRAVLPDGSPVKRIVRLAHLDEKVPLDASTRDALAAILRPQ